MLWAPASELIGRRWPLIWGIFGDGIFVIASATAKDIQTLLICRFFSGVFGASQLSIVPAVLADIFDDVNRGRAIAIYSLNVFVGPFSAPFIGGFIAESSLGWRWTLYVPAFMAFLSTISMFCLLKETYAPTILVHKAAKIRRYTRNWAIHAKQDEVEVDIKALIRINFLRPLRMLATEPVLLFVSLYMSFVYGLVYAFVEALPYVFETVYGMHGGVASLPFIGLIIGQLIACLFILSQHASYANKLHSNGGIGIPEWRLSPTLIGAPAFAIGLFW
jgi:DHA1 family multidrug resistance protein-like MFS transporter